MPGLQQHADAAIRELHTRGPNASGTMELDEASFVHTRLAILGLGPDGAQPAVSSDGMRCLVYNGEIYNFHELARDWRLTDSRSDTQVLLALLDRLGPADAAPLLRGMYAFGYYDRDTRTLFAARDPLGIKPLYVHCDPRGRPTVASTLAALMAVGLSHEVDTVALAGYLASGHTGPIRTLYRDVRKLEPGVMYSWQLTPNGGIIENIRPFSYPEYAQSSAAEALADSVRAHLISDVEVGAFLSGGVDSTLLSALAAREREDLKTYTVAFPESPRYDESSLAQWNASLIGSKHVVVPATARGMVKAAPVFIRQHGEPFGDAACLPLTMLAVRAAEDVKVVLCGEGSDEIFGGYSRYRVSRHLRTNESRESRLADWWAQRRRGQAWARAIEACLWGGGFFSHAALLDGDLPALRRGAPHAADRHLLEHLTDWHQLTAGMTNLDAARAYDRLRWLPNVYLEKTDRATMASGLEARVPFLDPAVIAARPRPRPVGTEKIPLRQALYKLLPSVRLPDRKKGLAVDVGALRSAGLDGPYRRVVESSDSIVRRAFGRSAQELLAERAIRSSSLLFRIAMLGVWEEEFDLDGLDIA